MEVKGPDAAFKIPVSIATGATCAAVVLTA